MCGITYSGSKKDLVGGRYELNLIKTSERVSFEARLPCA